MKDLIYRAASGSGMKMKIRMDLPSFFVLEAEEAYKHTSGAHRALAFHEFLGLLIGLGLEDFRKTHGLEEAGQEKPGEDWYARLAHGNAFTPKIRR